MSNKIKMQERRAFTVVSLGVVTALGVVVLYLTLNGNFDISSKAAFNRARPWWEFDQVEGWTGANTTRQLVTENGVLIAEGKQRITLISPQVRIVSESDIPIKIKYGAIVGKSDTAAVLQEEEKIQVSYLLTGETSWRKAVIEKGSTILDSENNMEEVLYTIKTEVGVDTSEFDRKRSETSLEAGNRVDVYEKRGTAMVKKIGLSRRSYIAQIRIDLVDDNAQWARYQFDYVRIGAVQGNGRVIRNPTKWPGGLRE